MNKEKVENEAFERGEHIRKYLDRFFNERTDSVEMIKSFNNFNDDDKKTIIDIIYLGLIKYTVRNSEDVDFQLSNGYSFQTWEKIFTERLSFNNFKNEGAEVVFAYKVEQAYKSFATSLLNKDEQVDNVSYAYKKMGFSKDSEQINLLSNINWFLEKNEKLSRDRFLWIAQEEAFFMTLPHVEASVLNVLDQSIKLTESLPFFDGYVTSKEDVSDIFDHELQQFNPSLVKEKINEMKKSEDPKIKKVFLLENIDEFVEILNPRVPSVLRLMTFGTAKKTVLNFFDKALEFKKEDDINLPLFAVGLSMLKTWNFKEEKGWKKEDKIELSDFQKSKIAEFSTIKKVDDETHEIYFDIKKMSLVSHLMAWNMDFAKSIDGELEFVIEANKDNRIPHRKFARLINDNLAEMNNKSSVIVEEEEQEGKLTGLYFVCKNVQYPEDLAHVMKEYFRKYKYSFSDVKNLHNISLSLDSYKRKVQDILINEEKNAEIYSKGKISYYKENDEYEEMTKYSASYSDYESAYSYETEYENVEIKNYDSKEKKTIGKKKKL